MVKLRVEFDVDIDDFKTIIDDEGERLGWTEKDYPEDANKTADWITDAVNDLEDLADFISDCEDNVKISKLIFEDKDEKEDLEEWLKEKKEEGEGEDD